MENKAKKITIGVMAVAAAALIGWDIVVAANNTKGDTISEILLKSSKKVPIVATAWGILTGHLFWPQRRREDE
jgi:hypothetical protein